MKDLAWIEIENSKLKKNIQTIRRIMGNNKILAPCIKANAYGHGLVKTGQLFLEVGADWLVVNSTIEAIKLRESGISEPILVIGCISKDNIPEIVRWDLRCFIYEKEKAEYLSNIAEQNRKTTNIHLKIDTGLNRQGVSTDEAINFARWLKSLPNIKVEGVATHFANSDQLNKPGYFLNQTEKFKKLIPIMSDIFKHRLILHCDKSASTLTQHNELTNMVRPGLAAYGYFSNNEIKKSCQKNNIILEPALTLKTKISSIKKIPANSYVGYGCSFKTTRPTTLAILPIGYYDGLDRKLSNKGQVLINGQRCKILGRICMNITTVDITDLDARTEQEVVIIGKQKKETITMEEVASWAETINYEVMTRLRESITRYYI